MIIKGFFITQIINNKTCYYSGAKMGAGFGSIYGAKIYKSKTNAQNAIDSHKWKNAKIVNVQLEVTE